ncbi:hypothetical protein ACLI09_13160 [Flavobacterium sp. RHBU_24]|uniref:hypothetical protein n=1 Tax=Flavobacterium sp. RHBU_24 TaxID=3391185 RepID=UPI0039848E0E
MKKLLLIPVMLLLAACGNSSTINKDFPDNRWPKTYIQTFSVNVTGDGITQLGLLFSFVSGPQFTDIPLSIGITAPDGSTQYVSILLDLTGKADGSSLDCAGDVCDLHTVLKNTVLTKGDNTITIKNNFKGPYVPNVLAVGVDLKEFKE